MKYYKNTELAKLYHVSEKSVRNWIAAAQEGKLDLQLYSHNDKSYISSTAKNIATVESLVQKGRKYKNSRGHKTVTPTQKFYSLFSAEAIFDIISSMDIHREIPLKYTYFNGGATQWHMYMEKLVREDTPNILSNTIELLHLTTPYLERLLEDYAHINIVDIGPGNGFPVRELLGHFKDNKLNRYIGIDVSQDILDITARNIHSWYGDDVKVEGYVRDINYDRFADLLASDSFSKDEATCNLVLFLGSTISNFKKANQSLAVIHESLGKNDLLFVTKHLDTEKTRRYFDFDTDTAAVTPAALSERGRFVLSLLNIDPSLYDVEQLFDEKRMARKIQIRFKVSVSVEFQLEGKLKIITFNKGESVLLWQHKHQDALSTVKQFDENDFDLLQAIRSKDQECLLTITKIKQTY